MHCVEYVALFLPGFSEKLHFRSKSADTIVKNGESRQKTKWKVEKRCAKRFYSVENDGKMLAGVVFCVDNRGIEKFNWRRAI